MNGIDRIGITLVSSEANKFYELVTTGIISTISALIVFYISEKIKNISKDRILLKKLSLELFEMIIKLYKFESSCKQFIYACNNYNLEDIGSIGFPNYIFPDLKQNIPDIFYHKNSDLYSDFIRLNNICFILKDLMIESDINNIKNDLLTKQVGIEEGKERYKQEQQILERFLPQIPEYINLVKKLYATILIINNHKSFLNFIYIKTHYSTEEINIEIERTNNQIQRTFSQLEDVVIQ